MPAARDPMLAASMRVNERRQALLRFVEYRERPEDLILGTEEIKLRI